MNIKTTIPDDFLKFNRFNVEHFNNKLSATRNNIRITIEIDEDDICDDDYCSDQVTIVIYVDGLEVYWISQGIEELDIDESWEEILCAAGI